MASNDIGARLAAGLRAITDRVDRIERASRLRPVPRDGEDGVSPDALTVAKIAAELIPKPEDGVSPEPQAIAELAAQLIPKPEDGVSPDPQAIARAAAELIPKPEDGVSPDPQAIAELAAQLIPKPEDGVSPDPQAIARAAAELTPKPEDGKDGASVTDVRVEKNVLFVWIDGVKKSAGKIVVKVDTFIAGEGGGGGVSAVRQMLGRITQNYMPIKRDGQFVDSPIRYDPVEDVLISSKTIQVPSQSLNVGQGVKLTDSGSALGYVLRPTGDTFELSGSRFSPEAGSIGGLRLTEYPAPAFSAVTQPDDSENVTTEDINWGSIITGPSGATLVRVYSIVLRGAPGPQAPVRFRIYPEDPALNPAAIPFYDNISDVPAWERGEEGINLIDGQDTFVDFETAQRLLENVPVWGRFTVPDGKQFSVKGATIDAGLGLVFTPYQESTIMLGFVRDLFSQEYRALKAEAQTFTNSDYDAAPVLKLDGAIDVLAGEYQITISFTGGVTTTNRSLVVGLFIDSVLQAPEYQKESKDVTDENWASKTHTRLITQGTHTVQVYFGRRGGDGAASVSLGDVHVNFTRIGAENGS